MKKELANPFPGGMCFFCGEKNAQGLHLTFSHDPESGETSARYVPEERFRGQGMILHGGIQMGLLDEIMGWASFVHTQGMAVTVNLDVRFLKPVYVNGESIRISCHVTECRGKNVHMRAELTDAHNAVCTTATGVYRALPPERFAALIQGSCLSSQGGQTDCEDISRYS